ncbi:MAG: ADOP family duplicated permease [Bryobacteraceae bacterium]|jgi:predicted permease
MRLAGPIRKLRQSICQAGAPRTHSDVEEEFRSTLEAYQEDLIRQGIPEEEARRKARVDLGRPSAQNETYRDATGLRLFDELGGDIRHGFRALRHNPGFAAIAVLSLALGIGATTAMFSLIYAVLLHPFPYAGADRIVNPVMIDRQHDGWSWFILNQAQFDNLSRAAPVESVLGFNNAHMEITGSGLPEDISGIYLTENAVTFFGVRPLLGRNLEPSDAENGGHFVAVLNYRFWQRHFGGDRHIVGQTLEINRAPYTIVGVLPRSFAFNDTTDVGDVYLPGSLMRDLANVPYLAYAPWIKLRPHVTLAAANAAIEPIVRQFAKEHPERFPVRWHLALQPIVEPFELGAGRTLMLLLAGVVLLLIIGCANCSILLLARGRTRGHELAIRSAIGASRWRIVRQLLVEAIVISSAGAALGVAASYWLARLPLLLSPDSFPAESVIRINAPILAFSVALALLCGVLFGLVPALRLSRHDTARMLPGRGVAAAPATHRWSVLIAAQVALTLLLMATAGAAIHGFLGLMQMPLGYDPANVLKVGIMLHVHDANEWPRIQPRAARAAYIEQLREKVASVHGVSTVAVAADATPPYPGAKISFTIDGTGVRVQPEARVMLVGQRYFAALRIHLVQGRVWNAEENARGDFIAVVNQAFAARYLSSSNALDRRLRIPDLIVHGRYEAASAQSNAWRQIIGVVGDARNDGVDRPVLPAIYVPYTTVMPPYVQFFVRTQGDPLAYLHSLRAAIASVASGQQISSGSFNGTFALNEAIERDEQYRRQRLFSILFGVFSAMGLTLAVVGIFSVVAYSVAQRTTEFGVRLALGAPRAHVLWVAARIALVSAAAGIVIGLTLDSFLGAVLAHWMQNAFAAGSLFAAAALLALSALLACLLPARHAIAVPPAEALRNE